MKVVINVDYGGFGLSEKALFYLADKYNLEISPYKDESINDFKYPILEIKSGDKISYYDNFDIYFYKEDSIEDRVAKTRRHPYIIDAVETLGDLANGDYAKLKIVEIPDDVDYIIEEYDGREWIAEKHRTWS